jgi:hypothetical protein
MTDHPKNKKHENDDIFDDNDSYSSSRIVKSSSPEIALPKSLSSASLKVPLPSAIMPPTSQTTRLSRQASYNYNTSFSSTLSPMSTSNNPKSMSVLSLSSTPSMSSQLTPKASNQQKHNQSNIPKTKPLPSTIKSSLMISPTTESLSTIDMNNESSSAVLSPASKSLLLLSASISTQLTSKVTNQTRPSKGKQRINQNNTTSTTTTSVVNAPAPSPEPTTATTKWMNYQMNEVEIQPHDLEKATTAAAALSTTPSDLNNTSTTSTTSDWLNTMMTEMNSIYDENIDHQQQGIPTKPTQLDLIDTYLQIQHHQQQHHSYNIDTTTEDTIATTTPIYCNDDITYMDNSNNDTTTTYGRSCTKGTSFPDGVFDTKMKTTASSSQEDTTTTTTTSSSEFYDKARDPSQNQYTQLEYTTPGTTSRYYRAGVNGDVEAFFHQHISHSNNPDIIKPTQQYSSQLGISGWSSSAPTNQLQIDNNNNATRNHDINSDARFGYRIVTLNANGQIDETVTNENDNQYNQDDAATDNDDDDDDDDQNRKYNRKHLQYIMENGGGSRRISRDTTGSLHNKPKVYCSSEEFYDDIDETIEKTKKINDQSDDDFNQLVVARLVMDGSQDFIIKNECIPAAIEFTPTKRYEYDIKQRRSRRCRIMLFLLFITIIIISTIVGIVISYQKKVRNNIIGNSEMSNHLNHPRLHIGIQQMIVQNLPNNHITIDTLVSSISFVGTLPSPSTSTSDPYTKAFYWITFIDEQQLVPNQNSTFLQRYLLAYIYYSTSRDGDWKICNPRFISNGTIINVTTLNTTTATGTTVIPNKCQIWSWTKLHGGIHDPQNHPLGSWLSSKNECKWAGIYCDNHGHVIMIGTSKFCVCSYT